MTTESGRKEANDKENVEQKAEKFTSFSEPSPPTVAPVTSAKSVVQSSRIASGRIGQMDKSLAGGQNNNNANRITLSRKPPVWREKPRIPIKPQSLSEVKAPSAPTESLKAQPVESALPGQMSVRFVHLTPAPVPVPTVEEQSTVPPLIPAADKELCTAVRRPSDELDSSPPPPPLPTSAQPDVEEDQVRPVIEINNNPIKSTEAAEENAASETSSTRGLTRSAFEALRANLAGSLELSRVSQPPQRSSTKRQAPTVPAEAIAVTIPTVPTPTEEGDSMSPSQPLRQPSPPVPPSPPSPPTAENQTSRKNSTERALSASPCFRNSLICVSPEGTTFTNEEEDRQPRSISLTRVERSDSTHLSSKPPSIRKILKERATQLLQRAESGTKSCSSGRLSRSDRFFASDESNCRKKGKISRFSIRKLFGFKKDSFGLDSSGSSSLPAEPLPVKVRPEIVHPIDFQGQVEVVTTPSAADPSSLTVATDSDGQSSLDLPSSESGSASQLNSLQSSANSVQSSSSSSSSTASSSSSSAGKKEKRRRNRSAGVSHFDLCSTAEILFFRMTRSILKIRRSVNKEQIPTFLTVLLVSLGKPKTFRDAIVGRRNIYQHDSSIN